MIEKRLLTWIREKRQRAVKPLRGTKYVQRRKVEKKGKKVVKDGKNLGKETGGDEKGEMGDNRRIGRGAYHPYR